MDRGDICHKSLVCGWGVSWGRWAGRCQRACETDGRTAGSLPWNRQTTAVMMTAYTHMCMHRSGCGAFPGSRSERVLSVSRIHKEIRIRNTTSCPFDWARVDVAGDDAPRARGFGLTSFDLAGARARQVEMEIGFDCLFGSSAEGWSAGRDREITD